MALDDQSDLKAATPAAVEDTKPLEEQNQDLVEVSRDDIAAQLGGRQPTASQMALAGRSLGLGFGETLALASGKSNLRLTRAQYEQLRAKFAAQTAQTVANDEKNADSKGSLCGTSGTPSPPAAKSVPPVTSENNNRKITVEGTKKHEGTVDGGTVTLKVNAQEDVDLHPDNFTIAYKGTDSPNQHWLQFIHREIVGIHADGSAHPVNDRITSTGTRGGSGYKLTLGGTASSNGAPKQENYNTDSADSADPFYETGGASNRTADSTTIIDMPSSMKPKIDAAFAAGAKKVVSRAHFDTYLVHTDAVTYHVQVSVIWEYGSSADDPRPSMTSEGGGKATELPSDIRATLHAQFPAFNFIK
jgi:hypothetical protein